MITPSNNTYKQINPKNINYNSYVIIEILLLILKSSEPISLGKDFSECICPKHEQVSIDFLLENNSLGAQTILDKTRWDIPAPLFNVGYMIFCSRHTFTVFAQHWKGERGLMLSSELQFTNIMTKCPNSFVQDCSLAKTLVSQ